MMYTMPLGQNANLTFTPKYMISLREGSELGDSFLGLNLGAGIGIMDNLNARPEVGLMFVPGEQGSFFNFGLGASWVFGKAEN
ncbi:hypothetical protein [Pararhodonellum marinum]|uniref:hypothetical protein n=1 Tax=Pararhodonellum marinum TaxID=2755358 RepID=UPI00188E4153|nr:hypothetical protein [Pararhodonellum marinum]